MIKILSSKENGPSVPGINLELQLRVFLLFIVNFQMSVIIDRFLCKHIFFVNRLELGEKCVYFVTVSDDHTVQAYSKI